MSNFKEKIVLCLFLSLCLFTLAGCKANPDKNEAGLTATTAPVTEEPTEAVTPDVALEPTEAPEIKTSTYSSLAAVHDPSIVKGLDGTYYIFGSHMEAAKSTDLFLWNSFASGVNSNNKLFQGLFTDSAAFDWVGTNDQGGYSVWAPDVFYNKSMGKWCMYFCTTTNWNTSTLCFATSDNIEGPYVFEANLIHSGFTSANVERTNVIDILGNNGEDRKYWTGSGYNSTLWPNALDPSVFYDNDGRLWMVYGSWSGGIFILELDEETGLVIHPEDDAEGTDKYFGKHLLGYGHNSCEGPYIIYSELSNYYYLFVSYGGLTSTGGYNIRMFRSKNPDGPYMDAAGQTWLTDVSSHSNYGVKVMGNYMLPSLSKAYMAPGHNSAIVDDDDRIYLVYHTRFDDGQEYHQPRVHQMFLNEDGWLVAAPFQFNEFLKNEEKISETGYSSEDIIGTYYFLNHMTDTSANIQQPRQIDLNADGTITGSLTGTWIQKDGTPYATININGIEYKGVFFKQLDESFQEVMTFTCVSEKNMCVWGVKYK